jgi:hypothetical protein
MQGLRGRYYLSGSVYMSLKLVINQTDEQAQRAKELKQMFVNLQCPRCKRVARNALELQELTDNCLQCGRQKH